MWVGKGCQKCNNSGFKGRIGFFELVLVHAALRVAISENRTSTQLTNTLPESHITIREDAIIKAAEGMTTIDEVLRATQDSDGDF
jgi:type II secretory ATPase GspE/PulE/Tfp pilus assembly ATPase PilB-like protein